MKRFAIVTALAVSVVMVASAVPVAARGHHGPKPAPTAPKHKGPHGPKGKHKAPLYSSDAYTCALGASDTTGRKYGDVAIKLDRKNMVDVKVHVKHGDASSGYGIYVNQDPGGCPTTQIATLTTDRHGNGKIRLKVAMVAGATVAWVSAVDATQVLRSTAVHFSK